ncbi:MAG: hypothetical protein P4L53_04860 [Candidatus Obscuribacterales bacterium]|nr:hypothetical protein [Candidatus Obscuribacterales bacterium]
MFSRRSNTKAASINFEQRLLLFPIQCLNHVNCCVSSFIWVCFLMIHSRPFTGTEPLLIIPLLAATLLPALVSESLKETYSSRRTFGYVLLALMIVSFMAAVVVGWVMDAVLWGDAYILQGASFELAMCTLLLTILSIWHAVLNKQLHSVGG